MTRKNLSRATLAGAHGSREFFGDRTVRKYPSLSTAQAIFVARHFRLPPIRAELIARLTFPHDGGRRPIKAGGTSLTMHSLSKPQRVPRGNNEIVTEDSGAIEFARLYADRLRFNVDAGVWREWTGSTWQESKKGLAFHFARELARDLAANEPDKVRYVRGKNSFAAGVERFARAEPVFATTANFWDRDPILLGTREGVVDLRTRRQRAAEPDDGITKATAVAPSRNADCLVDAFLGEATGGDEEMVRFLRQWFGYCLTGDTREPHIRNFSIWTNPILDPIAANHPNARLARQLAMLKIDQASVASGYISVVEGRAASVSGRFKSLRIEPARTCASREMYEWSTAARPRPWSGTHP